MKYRKGVLVRNAPAKRRKTPLLKLDPSRTLTLRRAMGAELARRFAKLKGAVVRLIGQENALGIEAEPTTNATVPALDQADFVHFPEGITGTNCGNCLYQRGGVCHERRLFPLAVTPRDCCAYWDAPGVTRPRAQLATNERWAFASDPKKLEMFQQWLRQQFDVAGLTDEELWQRYIEAGFKKGQGRAFDDAESARRSTPRPDDDDGDFYAGGREEFLRSSFGHPVSKERVELLASRAYDEMENVTDDMANKMSRVLSDGMVQGQSPREIGKNLAEQTDMGRDRANLVARTEIIRAHAEGQLSALDRLGVQEVGVEVEFTATDDDRVCPECDALSGTVYSIEDARGVIPVHPNCRCAFIPAGVGEDKGGKDKTEDDQNDDTTENVRNRSYFADCERDDKGRCLPSEGGEVAPKAEVLASARIAVAKVNSAPVPSKEDRAHMRAALEKAKSDPKARAGGDARGSAADRRARAQKLFKEFEAKDEQGNGRGYCVCPWTGIKMHWAPPTDKVNNPRGYPKFEQGKIFTACQGGKYRLSNLIPESFTANRSRNDARLRSENSRGC